MFKIISTGWNCAEFAEQTLRSIAEQSCRDFQVSIAYEAATPYGSGEGEKLIDIISHVAIGPTLVEIREPGHYLHDVRTRYEATMATEPADDDIIVSLDLDGDA